MIPWGERPLVVGEIRASQSPESAPTILCYGHFDVQPPDPLELWDSAPFELVERDGWLYARGTADDKGQLFMLLKAAELLAAAGELPVNLRFACDGEEEIGGDSIPKWIASRRAWRRRCDRLRQRHGRARRAGLQHRRRVASATSTSTVRTGSRDLHSGIYGGASLNAHARADADALGCASEPNGRLPEPLRVGHRAAAGDEVAAWQALPAGAAEIAAAGSRPTDAAAVDEFYLRTWAEPSVDVHGIEGGSPVLQKTVIPVEAQANVSIRLVARPGSRRDRGGVRGPRSRRRRPRAPMSRSRDSRRAPPGLVPADAPAVQLGLDAFEEILGVRPLLIRSGGAIPLVSDARLTRCPDDPDRDSR